jgi:hypothetical protein
VASLEARRRRQPKEEQPGNRRVFLACCRDLQKHETIAGICDFLQHDGCLITSTADFRGDNYSAMERAIEQSDVFISGLDEMGYGRVRLFCVYG